MKSLAPTLRGVLPAILALGAALLLPITLRAADHADAPALAQDQAADIADAYFFLDPNDNNQVVIIGTVHGFIVPGEAGNVAIFDPNVKFRFEIYNQHVNQPLPVLPPTPTPAQKLAYARAKAAYLAKVKVNKTIDVSFSKVVVPPQPTDPNMQDPKYQLQKPGAQSAMVTLTGFKDADHHGVIKTQMDGKTAITTTPASLAAGANTRTINTLSLNSTTPGTIKFFAGEVDDPFFFDVVGFSRLIKALHDGTPNPTANLARARDTFAGYNVLSIAITMPKSLLVDPSGPVVGLDFLTQRQTLQLVTNDGIDGRGGYKTVDRMGNPAVNTALIPFNKKNAYNASNVKADAAGTFLPDIAATITQLGLGTDDAHIGALANVAVFFGDLLRLDTTRPNGDLNTPDTLLGGGAGANGFPNGRRLRDDTIDFILTQLANGATTGDNVDANDVPLMDTFPFLALPHQPLANPNTDDGTRN